MDAQKQLAAVVECLRERQRKVDGLTVRVVNGEADPGLKPVQADGSYDAARPVERVENVFLRKQGRGMDTATITLDLTESDSHYRLRGYCQHEEHAAECRRQFSLEEGYQLGKAGVPCDDASEFASWLLSDLDGELDRLRDLHEE